MENININRSLAWGRSQTELAMFVGAGTYVTSYPDWLRKVGVNLPVNRERKPVKRQREPATAKFLMRDNLAL